MCCVKFSVVVFVLYFVCFVGIHAKEIRQDLACRSQSKCLKLHECQPYMDLLKNLGKPLKLSVVEFLRAQQCGFEEFEPKVCCTKLPKSLKILKNSRPSVNSGRLNKLMVKKIEQSFLITITSTSTTVRPGTTKRRNLLTEEERRKKTEAINKTFSLNFVDFSNDYDLFRRRKRSGDNNLLDIEVR
ncbi:unnamed protein product [Brassicogethes aeneus]|uniref:Clip domain-containing protein n=1 Tax=Brassicogethes aeneus TaxID=1431903 RepID=A0A9P0FD26_BRAAE|nr:unnamed protein product [Brassicogethes aeneus]